jgi:NADH:ubiquinone oxidoreductase subunit E
MAKDYSKIKQFVFVCNGKDCKSHGAKEIGEAVKDALKMEGLDKSTKLIKTKCTGRCKEAPVIIVKDQWHTELKPKDIKEIIDKAFKP